MKDTRPLLLTPGEQNAECLLPLSFLKIHQESGQGLPILGSPSSSRQDGLIGNLFSFPVRF
jgi:hypothetical protein